MTWNSATLTTVFDLLIIAAAVGGIWLLLSRWRAIPEMRASRGPLILALGLFVVALCCLHDVLAINGLPVIGQPLQGEQAIAGLHHHFELLLLLVAIGLIVLGSVRTIQILGRNVEDLRKAETQLSSQVMAQANAEKTLRESEQRFRDLAEGSALGVHVRNRDNKIVFVNDTYLRQLGYRSADDVNNHGSVLDFVHPEDRALVSHYAKQRLQGGEAPSQYDFRVQLKDGSVRWISNNTRTVNWFGEPHAHSTFMDITRQKEGEQALRDSERRYRQLLEGSTLGILIRQGRKIVYANQALADLFGFSGPAEVLALDSVDLLRAPSEQERMRRITELRDRGEAVLTSYEYLGLRKDGEELWVENHVQEITWEGTRSHIAFTFDISHRKAVEEQLLQAQKMEAVGQLTGGIAHDFNNLLSVIIGNTEILAERADNDPEADEGLTTIMNAAKRGANLTHRLLAFSRRQVLQPAPIDANDLIKSMAGLLQRTLGETIEVETVIAGGLWRCEVDPAQLENTLLNLAINARDAMTGGGKLTIETANSHLDDVYSEGNHEVAPGQYVVIAVSDTGSGMSDDVKARAFEPFFTTKGVGRGTGLGLSMTYGFVKQSGGHIAIYSEPDQGTTVKLYLPRTLNEVTEAKAINVVTGFTPQARGDQILVVEDDHDLRNVTAEILKNLGYKVFTAHDGQSGLEMIKAEPEIDLVLVDVVLPGGMSGPQMIEQAAALRPDLKTLYMSGYTSNAIVHAGRLDAGLNLINKPFGKADLAKKIRSVLGLG